MTTHEQLASELTRYLLGELTPAEREQLDRHLGGCGECRAELRNLQAGEALLAMSSPAVQPPQPARTRLLNAIASEPKHAPAPAAPPRRPAMFWWLWSPAIASLALAIAVALLWHDNRD